MILSVIPSFLPELKSKQEIDHLEWHDRRRSTKQRRRIPNNGNSYTTQVHLPVEQNHSLKLSASRASIVKPRRKCRTLPFFISSERESPLRRNPIFPPMPRPRTPTTGSMACAEQRRR